MSESEPIGNKKVKHDARHRLLTALATSSFPLLSILNHNQGVRATTSRYNQPTESEA